MQRADRLRQYIVQLEIQYVGDATICDRIFSV